MQHLPARSGTARARRREPGMSRIDNSEIGTRCWRTDHNQSRIINAAREAAHRKHGANSIEVEPASSERWLAILVEEVGELSHTLTYDARNKQDTVDELVDVLAVAGAWLDAWRVEGVYPQTDAWLA